MRTGLKVSLKSGAALLCFLATAQWVQAASDPTSDNPKPVRVAAAAPTGGTAVRTTGGTSVIETVVVTAEKREETAQKVAIPLTAVDGALQIVEVPLPAQGQGQPANVVVDLVEMDVLERAAIRGHGAGAQANHPDPAYSPWC